MVEFDNFSEAFRYAVDELLQEKGLKHENLYNEIDMDKSQWSKLYNGESKNPRPSTIAKLSKVVGVKFHKTKNDNWKIIKNENTDSLDSGFNEQGPVVRFRLVEEEIDKVEEPSLDYLRELYRLRDKLDEKIQKLVGRKDNSDSS